MSSSSHFSVAVMKKSVKSIILIQDHVCFYLFVFYRLFNNVFKIKDIAVPEQCDFFKLSVSYQTKKFPAISPK